MTDGIVLHEEDRVALVAWVVALFQGPLLGPTGAPRARIGGPASDDDLLPELADYAPLLAAAGAPEFALAQGELAISSLRKRPLLRGLKTRFTLGRLATLLRALGASHLQDYAEILLGFEELHVATHDPRPLRWAEELIFLLERHFGTRHGLSSLWLHGALPLYEPLTGILVESLFVLSVHTGQRQPRTLAMRSLDPFLENPAFLATGLWPAFVTPSPRSRPIAVSAARRIDLAKANTAMASALLAGLRVTTDGRYRVPLTRFLRDGLSRLDAPGGTLYNLAFLSDGGRRVERQAIVSSSNHAVIEVLLDAHATLGDDWLLQRALGIARFWLAQIHPDTGLMPDLAGGSSSFVDGNTDFAVIFWRLAEITGDEVFRAACVRLVTAVARYHKVELGLVRRTDLRTGAVIDPVIETRYTSLFLKPLLALGPDRPAGLQSLLRDR